MRSPTNAIAPAGAKPKGQRHTRAAATEAARLAALRARQSRRSFRQRNASLQGLFIHVCASRHAGDPRPEPGALSSLQQGVMAIAGPAAAEVPMLTKHSDLVHDCAFDYYGQRLATSSADGTIHVSTRSGGVRRCDKAAGREAGHSARSAWRGASGRSGRSPALSKRRACGAAMLGVPRGRSVGSLSCAPSRAVCAGVRKGQDGRVGPGGQGKWALERCAPPGLGAPKVRHDACVLQP